MPFLITDSTKPLLMDTVPALKIREFNGLPARGEVYAYMRCFAHNGNLHLSFTEFDEAPPKGVCMALALLPAEKDDKYLYLTVAKDAPVTLSILDAKTNDIIKQLAPPDALVITGSDEQGLYWSAETVLDKNAFEEIGLPMKTGSVFAGNVYLLSNSEEAFGAAFKVPDGISAPCTQGFEAFTVVPY